MPTPEQAIAIGAGETEILLEAGAGTGKTGVLVDRYCDAIEIGELEPDRILAFTFTDRAAGQLRDRVRAELERRARVASEEGRSDVAERLLRVVAEFGGAWITTIHGFCRRLLAAHPVAAGIDPSFRVLDAAEAQRVARRAFDTTLAEFLVGDEGEREATVAAYRIEGLRDLAIEVHSELRSRGEADPALPPPPAPDTEGALANLERCAAAASAESGGSAEQRRKMEHALELAAGRAERPPSLDELAPLAFGAKNGPRAECSAALKEAISRTAEREEGERVYLQLAELVRLFDRRFAAAKAERSGLDFEDLQLRAVGLLRDNPAVRSAYTGRFAQLLVDEFQDTNSLQLELVEALRGRETSVFFVGDEFQSIYGFRHADVEVFRGERERLRGAPGGAVLPLAGNFRSRPEVIAAANRLGELLLPGFRQLTVGSAEQGEGAPRGEGPAVELLLTERKGWEELDLDLPVDDRTAPRYVAEARFLAARLRALVDAGVRRGDIVVLLRAFTRVDAHEEALERAGLEPYVIGGRGYWSQQQVGDILCVLGTIANPLDDETLLGALASPACGVSPDALWLLRRASGRHRHLWPAVQRLVGEREPEPAAPEWLEHVSREDRESLVGFCATIGELREAGTRLSLEELIERTVTGTGYDLAVRLRPPSRMRLANLRKLMRMAREFESAEGRDLRGFLEFAAFRGERDDEAVAATAAEDHDGVRVMTIHNAKGLEFPVVAVPDLDRDLLVGGFPPAMRLGRPVDGRAAVGLRLTRFGAPSIPLYEMEELAEERKRLDSEEALRLFYVAATRAKERLILSSVTPRGAGGEVKPGTPVIERIVVGLGIDVERGDTVVALPPPPPREGLEARFAEAKLAVGINSASEESAAQLTRASTVPDAGEPPNEDPPPSPSGPLATPLRPLSYSALAEHGRCGYRFYVERVLGLEPPPEEEERGGGSRGERLGFGNAVHSLLESSARAGWSAPSPERVAAVLAAENLDPMPERVAEVLNLIHGWSASPLCAELAQAGTRVDAELPLLMRLGGTVIRGKIDVMARPADGPPLLIDYKTDRLDGASPAEAAAKYSDQRLLYALAAARATGAERVRVAHVFLEAPHQPEEVELGKAELDEARASLEARVEAIASGHFAVTPNPTWQLCHDCPARRRLCPSPAPQG